MGHLGLVISLKFSGFTAILVEEGLVFAILARNVSDLFALLIFAIGCLLQLAAAPLILVPRQVLRIAQK